MSGIAETKVKVHEVAVRNIESENDDCGGGAAAVDTSSDQRGNQVRRPAKHHWQSTH